MPLPQPDPSLPSNPVPLFSDIDAARGDHLRALCQKIWQNLQYLYDFTGRTTDTLSEGITNLYFLASRVLSSVLSGFSVGANSTVTSSDTVLQAFGKVQGQINALQPTTGSYTPTITASVSNPTKATTPDEDIAYWTQTPDKRLTVSYRYLQTSNSGSAAGSGTYFFSLPVGKTIDTSRLNSEIPVGVARVYDGANIFEGQVLFTYSAATNKVSIEVGNYVQVFQQVGGGYADLANIIASYELNFTVPIT